MNTELKYTSVRPFIFVTKIKEQYNAYVFYSTK